MDQPDKDGSRSILYQGNKDTAEEIARAINGYYSQMAPPTPTPPILAPATIKSKRPPSRPQRWADAVGAAREAFDKLDECYGAIEEALGELNDLKSEYEEWQGNLPENLQQSALGEKLQTIVDMDFDQDPRNMSADEIGNLIDEAENADLPRGFGKD